MDRDRLQRWLHLPMGPDRLAFLCMHGQLDVRSCSRTLARSDRWGGDNLVIWK